jgi:hypothetical protein
LIVCSSRLVLLIFREAQRLERLRAQALASDGQKNLKTRVQHKRTREKEQLIGAKKHEAAMKEMARRKLENSRKPAKMGVSGAGQRVVGAAAKGISAGIRNKNKHLQEFENMKASYRKKKG